MADLDIYFKITTLSKDMKREVENFVDFLKSKASDKPKLKMKRRSGLAKGMVRMKDNFDDPIDDFKAYM